MRGSLLFRPAPLAVAVFFLLAAFPVLAQTLEETQDQFLKGKYTEVVQTAQKKVNAGSSADWRVLLVKSQLMVGRYADANTNALQGLNGYNPDFRMLLLSREAALFQNDSTNANRRLADIKALLDRRASSYPSGESLVAVGQALLLLGVEPRLVMENCIRRAEKMDAPTRDAFLATAELALDKHDFALAADTARAGLKKFPNDADLLGDLARAFESGDRSEMLTQLKAALAANPKHIPSLLLLAKHKIDAEDYDGAEKDLATALAVNPHRPEALAYRAVLAHLHNDEAQEEKFRADALQFWKTNPEVDYLIGSKLSQKYRFKEGAAAQKRALAFEPDYFPARRQLAQDWLRLGQTDDGWKLVEAVHKQNEYDVTAYNLSMLHEQMEKFQTLSNADFLVRMSPLEASLYGDRVLNLLGRAKEVLTRKYGFELAGPTTVEIFPEQKDFSVRTFGMPDNPGYLGVCFGSVITANSPASQAPNPANWESVLWHEFCHVVTLSATKNRMPRWLSEGISVYEERRANPTWGEHLDLAYREMILEGDLAPIKKLSGAFLAPKTPQHLQFAYYESSMVVEHLVEKYGIEALKKILRDLGDGKEINESIAAHTAPLPDLERDFDAFVKDLAGNLAPGADLEKPPVHGSEADFLKWKKAHPKNYYLAMRTAKDLIAEKKWAEAKPVLLAVADLYHGERRADNPLWQLAVVQRQLQETNAELASLEKFAQQESDFTDLSLRLIELAQERNDWAAMTRHAERLLAINPLASAPYRALAQANVALGKNNLAIEADRKLLLLDPPNPAEVHFELARLLKGRGDSKDEAKRNVLEALEEAPRFRDAQRLLLEIVGNPAREEKSATTAIK
ncbi:MAG: hypothetical protein ABIQ35_09545 [Verrucomicrobiota bacterium]